MQSDFPDAKPHKEALFRVFFSLRKLWWRRKLLRSALLVGLGMVLGTLILALLSAGEIYEYQDTVDGVHLPEVDVIVCLAGGRGRIAAAGDLWYRYWELDNSVLPAKTPVLYFSGMGHFSNWGVLSRQVRRGVLEALGPQNVVLETESSNTQENAEYFARYAKQKGWARVLLVTSNYHVRRARLIFEQVLKASETPMTIETLSVYQEPFEPGEWHSGIHGIRVTLNEYLKWLYYKYFWTPSRH